MAAGLSVKRVLQYGLICLFFVFDPLLGQQTPTDPQLGVDSDHDGLSDALEQRLLEQFAPKFMVGEHDCSTTPAEFKPDSMKPEVEAENGTIYGQVFPTETAADQAVTAEIHYYHLWRKDCGEHGHPLDTEHVSVLVRASESQLASAAWKAVYWYAAAHENTMCDVSQISRASTLDAVDHGATIWVSPGKHASYLNDALCQEGCGADRCEKMVPLASGNLINLGEPGLPMNGSQFIASKAWPLELKMARSDFPLPVIGRLHQLPTTDIAWFHPGRHPIQGIIKNSSSTEQAMSGSGRNTTSAISLANASTGNALSKAGESTVEAVSVAGDSTGSALQKSYRHTWQVLSSSARHVGTALDLTPAPGNVQPR